MKRGRPKIKPQIEKLIIEKARDNRDIPRLALAVELRKLIEEMGEIPPSEETIIKRISQARNSKSPLNEPWSLGTLESPPIPPEALKYVLKVWLYCRRGFRTLTIREAKWVSRLYPLFKNNVANLTGVALFYAEEEMLAEISGVSFYGLGREGVLNLYEMWKGEKFGQAERSQLLLAPDLTTVEQRHRFAELQGGSLREFRERNANSKAELFAERKEANNSQVESIPKKLKGGT